MPLTATEKRYYQRKISALRKAVESLEDELGLDGPVSSGRHTFKNQLEINHVRGTWSKPQHLKRRKS